jgi:3-hydroxyacyl-[acyl-carrier-protein] dehydratase
MKYVFTETLKPDEAIARMNVESAMNREAIEQAIPHRPPFLLVDEIVEQEGDRIVCRKKFTDDEYFFAGHYPDFPIVPGVLLCEAAMQAGAILLSQFVDEDSGAVPVATRMSDVKFRKMIRPNDTVDLEVTLEERLADAFFMKGKVTCEDKTAVTFNFACTLAPQPTD